MGFGAGPGRSNGSASFDFGFPTSGPVANLPEGYTLNSADGRIVDNRFVAPVLFGDYNGNGVVDDADYVVWRKNEGTQLEYNTWRANFGETVDSDAAPSFNATAPEPASAWLMMLVAALGTLRGRHIGPRVLMYR